MGKFGGVGSSTVLTDLQVDGTTVTVDVTNDRLGVGTAAPGTQIQVESTVPYITLKNSTAENTAAGCESRIIFEDHGNNSLGLVEVSHVGTSDDEKGQMIFKTNNDSGLQTALTISEAQLATFAGAVTVGGALTVDSVGVSAIQTSAESFADNDTSLMTSAAIDDRINTAVTAEDLDVAADSGTAAVDLNSQSLTVTGGTGVTTSATGQAVTVALDLSGLSAVTPTATDSFATLDSDGSTEQLTTITALATFMTSDNTDGLSSSGGKLALSFAAVGGMNNAIDSADFFMIREGNTGTKAATATKVGTFLAGAGLASTSGVLSVEAAQAITSVTADLTVAGGDLVLGATAIAGTISGVTAASNTAGNAVTIQGGSALGADGSANTGVGGAVVIQGGAGKGTAAGGSIVFKSATAGGSSTALNSINDTILTLASDLSATFTGAVAATGFTAGTNVITDDSIVMTPSTDDTVTIAAATNGALNITTVDNAAHGADLTLTVDGDTVIKAEGTTVARAVGTATASTTNIANAFSFIRPVLNVTADTQLYAGDSGALVLFADAAATITLPDSGLAANLGVWYTFMSNDATASSAKKVIVTDTTNERFVGVIKMIDVDSSYAISLAMAALAANVSFTFNGSTTGIQFSKITIMATAADKWTVIDSEVTHTGDVATPFATS